MTWQARVKDPNWFVRCRCGHAEQMHTVHGCTAGPLGRQCACGKLVEAKREWVGKGPKPVAAA